MRHTTKSVSSIPPERCAAHHLRGMRHTTIAKLEYENQKPLMFSQPNPRKKTIGIENSLITCHFHCSRKITNTSQTIHNKLPSHFVPEQKPTKCVWFYSGNAFWTKIGWFCFGISWILFGMCWFYFGKVFGFIRILLGYFRYMFGLFRSFHISILNINELRIYYTIYIHLRKTKKKNRIEKMLRSWKVSVCHAIRILRHTRTYVITFPE